MPIYGGEEQENRRMADDVRRSREKHDQEIEAMKILKKDIPPFLAIALALRVVGKEVATELYKTVSKNKAQKS